MHLLRKRSISRRTMLRGAVAGSSVVIGLPLLDAMLDDHGEALAGGEPLPRCFVSWLVANGFLLDRFEPTQTGASWELSEQLAPLAPVKDYTNLCTGFTNHGADDGYVSGHLEGMTAFTGYPLVPSGLGYDAGGPSIDQVIADAIGNVTPVRSLQVAVSKANAFASSGSLGTALSFRGTPGALTPLPPRTSPKDVWQSLFGSYAANAELDDRAVRSLMLDAVRAQSEDLRGKVGTIDRARIDAHLEGVAELAQKINAATPSCELPGEPDEENLAPVGAESIAQVNALMAELIGYALRCDITRVASVMFVGLAGEIPFTEVGITQTAHLLSHESQYNLTTRERYHEAIVYEMTQLSLFVQVLAAIEDPTGASLLDRSIIYCSSDCSVGWLHSVARQPVLLFGTGGGYLQYPGVHVQGVANDPDDPNGVETPDLPSAGNTSDIALACLQAFDPAASTFGGGAALSTSALSDILA